MTQQISDKVAQKLDNLPDKPGCYQMLDKKGKVIYVGKALVLRNRVRSYFHASAQRDAKTSRLVAEIDDLTWWVTSTELEALILENELIKRYKPHYNIKLKDDRQFPYIKVHWQDDFPKVSVVRRMQKDGARYFGPYSSSRACYQTMDALRRVFPIWIATAKSPATTPVPASTITSSCAAAPASASKIRPNIAKRCSR
ncbi:MAG: GIY-YIG nuclease family protein [Caldilineaceae bacterium]